MQNNLPDDDLKWYNNIVGLKKSKQAHTFSEEQVQEYIKCFSDPLYFIETYVKIVSIDHGPVLFKLYPYQKRIIEAIHNNTRIISKISRQNGKSTTVAAYICWFVLFNDYKNATILANKLDVAKEIFGRVQFAIENLPSWLQQGVIEWNKKSFVLENGSSVFAAATSPSAVRGRTCSLLFLDEFAHLTPNLADDFMKSVFPTLSSSNQSKMAIVSTPKGLNHFYKIWTDSENGLNTFIRVEGHWSENPNRDDKWAKQQLEELGKIGYAQEVEVKFIGSSYTLVSGDTLARLVYKVPEYESTNFEIFTKPEPNHSYVVTVDTSRGRGLDYSAFSVIDVSKIPYEVVATYKDNEISTLEYPHLIFNTARQYNEAYILIENNDLGEEVANILWHDYEYENIYFSSPKGLSEIQGVPGVRTTKKVKGLGCSVLKDLIEQDQLILNSYKIIQELSHFVLKNKSYEADDKIINDDLMSTLWLFAWLSKQEEFKAVTNIDIRAILAEQRSKFIDDQMTPFAFYDNGTETVEVENPDREFYRYNMPNLSDDQKSLLSWNS